MISACVHVSHLYPRLVLASLTALSVLRFEQVVKSRSRNLVQEVLDLVVTVRMELTSTFNHHIEVMPTFFFCPFCPVFTRFRLLITSVLRLIGRARPCNLRNKPQALHKTEPPSSRRQSGVVLVEQFWHVGCDKNVSVSGSSVIALSIGSQMEDHLAMGRDHDAM